MRPRSYHLVMLILAISLATIGAFGLAVGTHLQHRAIGQGTKAPGQSMNIRVVRALRNPLWVLGTVIIVVQTVLNVVALGLAPVAVVQPVGSLALVCAVIISARAIGIRMNRRLVLGIAAAVGSVVLFTAISSAFVREVRPTETTATVLAWLLLCLTIIGVAVAYRSMGHITRVVTVGVMFGAVASTMHIIAGEVFTLFSDDFGDRPAHSMILGAQLAAGSPISLLTLWILLVLVVIATVVGAWLVQTAYSSGPPETVLAGLTVIDPFIAVLIGAFLLGEYAPVPPLGIVGITLSGVAACISLMVIVRNHPALLNRKRFRPRERSL